MRRLRKVVREVYGSRKGTLSSLVEGAIKEVLDRQGASGRAHGFRAFRAGEVVAVADNLGELAEKLRRAGIEPRGIRIEPTSPVNPVVRTGPRNRRG